MNTPTIVAYGEVLWDLLPSGPVLGGAPFNFVYRVNSLGYRGVMLSRVGADAYGEQALAQMRNLGIGTDGIQQTSDYPTGTVNVFLDDKGTPDFTILPNVAYDYIQATSAMTEALRNADCVCFGTVAQRSAVSRKTLAHVLENFSGQHILYDINLRKDCYTEDVIRSSLAHSTILKLNEHEVPVVAKLYDVADAPIAEFVNALFPKTELEYCLVTLGEHGAFAASRGGEHVSEPAYRVNLVDTCGSGDACTAGFLYGLLEEKPLREACRFGNALGAMVAEQSGATQPISFQELTQFMQTRDTVEV